MDPKLLNQTLEHAQKYLDSLASRPVKAQATKEELNAILGGPLPEHGEDPLATIDRLAHAGEAGTTACTGPRYFGFVVGGSLPAARAADWLATTWDQNAGLYAISPVNSVAEEVSSEWLVNVLGLPNRAAVGFVTGGMMANFSCLAAARHEMLKRVGWDVEDKGLQGAPKVNIIVGDEAHVTIFNALRLLGLGASTHKKVKADNQGRMIANDLSKIISSCEGPTIICAQAGNVNSGAFDPIDEIADLAKRHGAWLHVDGAFGLWAAVSPKLKYLLKGNENADSWATDAHKWLNVPYDCGLAFVADPTALRGAFASTASYLVPTRTSRDPHEYVPEFSRRARGIAVYAAIRSLGRAGLCEMIERNCDQAKLFAMLLSSDKRVEILNDVVLNQVVVRFGDSDELTAAVIQQVQNEGVCWLAGSQWKSKGVMRISVCNWSTTASDVEMSASAILKALNEVG